MLIFKIKKSHCTKSITIAMVSEVAAVCTDLGQIWGEKVELRIVCNARQQNFTFQYFTRSDTKRVNEHHHLD